MPLSVTFCNNNPQREQGWRVLNLDPDTAEDVAIGASSVLSRAAPDGRRAVRLHADTAACRVRLGRDTLVPADAGIGVVFTTNDTITRNDGGNFIADGFKAGGQVTIASAEDGDNNSTYVILTASAKVLTVGTVAVVTPNGFDFVDGGVGEDQIVRNDGRSWINEGYKVAGTIQVRNATNPANDLSANIISLTASTINVITATLTADTDDNTANFGPLINNAQDTAATMASTPVARVDDPILAIGESLDLECEPFAKVAVIQL